MAKEKYDELMQRYLTNQVTEEEQLRIDAWLDMLVDNDTRNLELSDEEKGELYQKFISKQQNIEAITSYRPDSLIRLQRWTWIKRIAAILLVVALTGLGAYRFLSKENAAREAGVFAENNVKKMRLKDGTLVWTKHNTKLTYHQAEDIRHVAMDGEALFEVAKDPALPFVIEYGDVNIKVYGTSFSLKTGDQVELKVLTGKVRVTTDTDSTGVLVGRNEQVVYSAQNGLQKKLLPVEEASVIVKNSDYDMLFDHAPLGTVLTRLEKKFDVSFNIDNPAIKDCGVVLNITDNSLEDSLKKIAAILHVEYKIDGSVIKLTGTGCN